MRFRETKHHIIPSWRMDYAFVEKEEQTKKEKT
jgi:hypothetical protein